MLYIWSKCSPLFRAWGTYGGHVANCNAANSVSVGAIVCGIGAIPWCFKELQLRDVLVQVFCWGQFQWWWMWRLWCTLQQSKVLIFLFHGCVVLWQRHWYVQRGDNHKNAIVLQSLISATPKQIWELQYIIFRSNTLIKVSRLNRSMRSGWV